MFYNNGLSVINNHKKLMALIHLNAFRGDLA